MAFLSPFLTLIILASGPFCAKGAATSSEQPSFANCTIKWFEQPLDHFNGNNQVFRQRVCVYEGFRKEADEEPAVLFYTGNEGPVDMYVNNTGLMWDLGKDLNAVLIFAEHRYFGESFPKLKGMKNCLAYVSSAQALADYAMLLPVLKDNLGIKQKAKVVAFGGSYGGMLSAWFRTRYPNVCNGGAVAASAPVWGYASAHPPLDGSFQAITNGAQDKAGKLDQQCKDSYLATWVLIKYLSESKAGRDFLNEKLGSCEPISSARDGIQVVNALQDVLFLLAESNYPFPSDYIVFSVINKRGYKLPAWPMRKACSMLKQPNSVISLDGNRQDVNFNIDFALTSGKQMRIQVDWDKIKVDSNSHNVALQDVIESPVANHLVRGIRDIYGMLFNITGDQKCLSLLPLENSFARVLKSNSKKNESKTESFSDETCKVDKVPLMDAWGAIVCNEGLNLVQDVVRGVGNDMYWPPSVERNAVRQNYTKVVLDANRLGYCSSFKTRGLYGVTDHSKTLDPLGRWGNAQYQNHGVGLYGASNIIYSNGYYDPWSAAGVLQDQSKSIVSLMMKEGAHHTDLMFATKDDPESIKQVRATEKSIIKNWLNGADELRSELSLD